MGRNRPRAAKKIADVAELLSARYGLEKTRVHYRIGTTGNLILPLDLAGEWLGQTRFDGSEEWEFWLVTSQWAHFERR